MSAKGGTGVLALCGSWWCVRALARTPVPPIRNSMNRLVSIVLCVIAALVTPQVVAQQFTQAFDSRANLPFREMDSGLVLRDISWGWKGDALPVEVHAPVRIWLDSGDKAISGTMSIEYSQDASQNAKHVAQFATTPGKGTVVEFAVCAKSFEEQFTITIDDGDQRLKIPVVQFPNRDELGMPGHLNNQLRIVAVNMASVYAVTMGLPSVRTPDWNNQLSGDEVRDYAFSNADVVRKTPLDLPTSWIAYESVDALVIKEDDLLGMPQRQREAIDAWVIAGGKLIVQIAGAGEGWRRAVPQAMWSDVPRDAITFGEVTTVPLAKRFGEELRRETRAAKANPGLPPVPSRQTQFTTEIDEELEATDGSEDGEVDDESSMGKAVDEDAVVSATKQDKVEDEVAAAGNVIAPNTGTNSDASDQSKETSPPASQGDAELFALTVSGRVATLSPAASRAGWKVLITDGALKDNGANSGLIVGGPAGFGTVELIGADPDRYAAILSDVAAGSAWRTILTASLPTDAIEQYRAYNQYGYWFQSSGANQTQQEALRACMDLVTAARPVSPWFFFITAVAVFLMALAVGPVGRIYLKRRNLLTRSWVVAIVLIAGASVLSVLAPKLVRSGQSMIGRFEVHDVRCDETGQPVRAATTRLVTMFSGKPESLPPIDGFDPKNPSFAEGSWWRGVSSVHGRESATRFGDSLTMLNTSPMPGELRSAAAMPIKMGQWTFRAAVEQSPATSTNMPTLRAELRGDRKVHLSGIPEGKRLDAVWVYAEGAGVNVSQSAIEEANKQRGKGGSVSVVADAGNVPANIAEWLAIVPTNQNGGYNEVVASPKEEVAPLPWYSAMLPGASRRSHATQMLVESGWALVVVSLVDDALPDTQSSLATQRFEVYRMIVPRKVKVSGQSQGLEGNPSATHGLEAGATQIQSERGSL